MPIGAHAHSGQEARLVTRRHAQLLGARVIRYANMNDADIHRRAVWRVEVRGADFQR
jgi:uncharacterized protein YjbI with pentapeptide repeats